MKITFFIGSLSGGGAERMTSYLANFLSRKGHEITVLTMSDVKDTYILDKGVQRDYLLRQEERKNSLYNNFIRFFRLGNYMKSHDCDCYIVMLPSTIAMMLMQKNKSTASFIASERNNPQSYGFFVRFFQKHIAKRADAWVFQTESAKKWYGKAPKKCTVIPNAINENLLNRRTNTEKSNEIIAVGRLDKQKNYNMMLLAFSHLIERHPNYILRIFGQGPLESKLKALTKEMGLDRSVVFEGYVENVWDRMEKGRMYVLSSDYEGMPNALIEAMALGMPCVSTDCPAGGPAFLIEDGKNGLLVPVGDADALSRACEWIIDNKDKADMMGVEAQKIRDRLNSDTICKQWEDLINNIAEKRNDKS